MTLILIIAAVWVLCVTGGVVWLAAGVLAVYQREIK
jgi:hypothetical protein